MQQRLLERQERGLARLDLTLANGLDADLVLASPSGLLLDVPNSTVHGGE